MIKTVIVPIKTGKNPKKTTAKIFTAANKKNGKNRKKAVKKPIKELRLEEIRRGSGRQQGRTWSEAEAEAIVFNS